MARSSLLGWIFTYVSLIPVIGETVMRLRNFPIVAAVFRGGVVDAKSIPPALHDKKCMSSVIAQGITAHLLPCSETPRSWETATKDYGRITVPVLLVWGDQDWARPSERQHDGESLCRALAQ